MVYYRCGVGRNPSRYVAEHVHPFGWQVGGLRRKAAHSGSNMPNVGRDRPAMEASTALAAVIRSRLNRFVPPLTVDELADRSGVISRSTLQTRMNKNRAKALAFYVEEVWAIADVLGVSPHVLFEDAEGLRASGQIAPIAPSERPSGLAPDLEREYRSRIGNLGNTGHTTDDGLHGRRSAEP
jgi:transcriptional regulator with XRE-family HTH domain